MPLKRILTNNRSIYRARKMLLDLLGKKSMSLHTGIFMNDLAIEIKNLGLGITVGDHDPFHGSTRLRTHLWPDAGCIHRQRPTNIV